MRSYRLLPTLALLTGCGSLLGIDPDGAYVRDGGASVAPTDKGTPAGTGVNGALDGALDGPLDAVGSLNPPLPLPIPPDDAGGCSGGRAVCGAECVAVDDPRFGCGTASCAPCSIPHGDALCAGSGCGIARCEAGRDDCDGQVATGCETEIGRAHDHCGSCARACAVTEVCNEGMCAMGCSAGLTACGGSCVDLSTDASHCGGCTRECPAPPSGIATCASGQCGVVCNTNYHLCGGQCVADTTSTCGLSCAACGAAPANATERCTNGACGFSCWSGFAPCGNACCRTGCPSGQTDCGGNCIDLSSSPNHCGTCTRQCQGSKHGNAVCAGGSCALACNTGYASCGTICTVESATACGAECMTCPGAANGVARCNSGQCDVVCDGGYRTCASGCCLL